MWKFGVLWSAEFATGLHIWEVPKRLTEGGKARPTLYLVLGSVNGPDTWLALCSNDKTFSSTCKVFSPPLPGIYLLFILWFLPMVHHIALQQRCTRHSWWGRSFLFLLGFAWWCGPLVLIVLSVKESLALSIRCCCCSLSLLPFLSSLSLFSPLFSSFILSVSQWANNRITWSTREHLRLQAWFCISGGKQLSSTFPTVLYRSTAPPTLLPPLSPSLFSWGRKVDMGYSLQQIRWAGTGLW